MANKPTTNVSKTVFLTMSQEIAELYCAEKNKSGLIRALLEKHYEDKKLEALPVQKIDELISLVQQKNALEAQMEAIKNGIEQTSPA